MGLHIPGFPLKATSNTIYRPASNSEIQMAISAVENEAILFSKIKAKSKVMKVIIESR